MKTNTFLSNYRSLAEKAITLLVKIFVGGGINYILNLALTFVLSTYLNVYYLLAFAITQTVLLMYGFIYNAKVVFADSLSVAKLSKYFVIVISMALVNIGLVKFTTEVLGLFYLLSISLVLVTTIGIKYLLFWVFVFYSKSYDKVLTGVKNRIKKYK
jgi:putative flippase GtrA